MDENHVSGEQMNQGAAVPPSYDNSSQMVQDRTVPLSALEAERAKRQQTEEENRMMREHFALMQAQAVRQAPPTPPKDEFDGLSDSDVLTVGEYKKHTQRLANQFGMTLEELRMAQRHPDYQEVVSKYLPEVFKTNPNIREKLQQTQDYELAYYLAKNSDAYRSSNIKQQRNEDAERILKNSQQSGTLSSLGGSTPVSQAKRYKDMSDEEFRNLSQRNMGY